MADENANTAQNVDLLLADLKEPLKMRFAASILAWIDNERAIDAVINAVREEDHRINQSAFDGLSRGGELVTERLIKALQHPDPLVREFVLEVLGEIKDPSTCNAIASLLLVEDNHLTRQAAIDSLGNLGNAEAIPYLSPFLNHKNKFTRWMTVDALGRIGTKNALELVSTCLTDPDEDVRHEAENYLTATNGGFTP